MALIACSGVAPGGDDTAPEDPGDPKKVLVVGAAA
jgi:hypothetical protein